MVARAPSNGPPGVAIAPYEDEPPNHIAAILAPLVDVAQMFLSTFRFSFNLMTWRDPNLTFWFVLFGIVGLQQ